MFYLNTTFVSLQQPIIPFAKNLFGYLNTTFVSLQQLFRTHCLLEQNNLNTTFVSLQPLANLELDTSCQIFKYNFCFSSTLCNGVRNIVTNHLNTTFVSLQPFIDIPPM